MQSINNISHNAQADYYELKLTVSSITATAFNHLLGCYCYTPGVGKNIEPTPLYKKVNFYKFKEWICDRDWIINFEDWKERHYKTAHFYQCLSDYINDTENRSKIYIEPTALSMKLDSLISQAKEVTAIFQSMV